MSALIYTIKDILTAVIIFILYLLAFWVFGDPLPDYPQFTKMLY